MIKAIIFDLDGVLVDADKWHYNALNVALQHSDIDPISWQEHLTIYKGIPTRKKFEILTERKGLSPTLYEKIYASKQDLTMNIISNFCVPDPEKIEMLRLLSHKYPVYVCSNAIQPSVLAMLTLSGSLPLIKGYLSSYDVKNPKPDPEIYLKIFDRTGLYPYECVIVEDSDPGYKAAMESGAVVCKVNGPDEVNYYRVLKTIKDADRVNIVIPASGHGKRFVEAGYTYPKPLIDVNGSPMLDFVLKNFRDVGHIISIMQKQQIQKYCMQDIFPNIQIVEEEGILRGAATSVLVAKELINTSNELIIANSDQYLERDLKAFVKRMRELNADGGIITFKANHPKWSYAKYDETGKVSEVAEKVVISDQATVGIYYYKHGRDFVKYAEQMIAKGIKTNNEFYVCPIYNEFIADNKKIYIYTINESDMHGLGTPEDLQLFLRNTHV